MLYQKYTETYLNIYLLMAGLTIKESKIIQRITSWGKAVPSLVQEYVSIALYLAEK